MKLAKVLGTVVATEKDDKLGGLRFLMLGNWGHDNKPAGGSVAAGHQAPGDGVLAELPGLRPTRPRRATFAIPRRARRWSRGIVPKPIATT